MLAHTECDHMGWQDARIWCADMFLQVAVDVDGQKRNCVSVYERVHTCFSTYMHECTSGCLYLHLFESIQCASLSGPVCIYITCVFAFARMCTSLQYNRRG